MSEIRRGTNVLDITKKGRAKTDSMNIPYGTLRSYRGAGFFAATNAHCNGERRAGLITSDIDGYTGDLDIEFRALRGGNPGNEISLTLAINSDLGDTASLDFSTVSGGYSMVVSAKDKGNYGNYISLETVIISDLGSNAELVDLHKKFVYDDNGRKVTSYHIIAYVGPSTTTYTLREALLDESGETVNEIPSLIEIDEIASDTTNLVTAVSKEYGTLSGGEDMIMLSENGDGSYVITVKPGDVVVGMVEDFLADYNKRSNSTYDGIYIHAYGESHRYQMIEEGDGFSASFSNGDGNGVGYRNMLTISPESNGVDNIAITKITIGAVDEKGVGDGNHHLASMSNGIKPENEPYRQIHPNDSANNCAKFLDVFITGGVSFDTHDQDYDSLRLRNNIADREAGMRLSDEALLAETIEFYIPRDYDNERDRTAELLINESEEDLERFIITGCNVKAGETCVLDFSDNPILLVSTMPVGGMDDTNNLMLWASQDGLTMKAVIEGYLLDSVPMPKSLAMMDRFYNLLGE